MKGSQKGPGGSTRDTEAKPGALGRDAHQLRQGRRKGTGDRLTADRLKTLLNPDSFRKSSLSQPGCGARKGSRMGVKQGCSPVRTRLEAGAEAARPGAVRGTAGPR